jgi:hypothetical protein
MAAHIFIDQGTARAAQAVRSFVSKNQMYLYSNLAETGGVRRIAIVLQGRNTRKEIGVLKVVPVTNNAYRSQVQWYGNPGTDSDVFWRSFCGYIEALPVFIRSFGQGELETDLIGEELNRFMESANLPTWNEPVNPKPTVSRDVFVTVEGDQIQYQLYKVYDSKRKTDTPIAQIIIKNRVVTVECLLDDPTTIGFFGQVLGFMTGLLGGQHV